MAIRKRKQPKHRTVTGPTSTSAEQRVVDPKGVEDAPSEDSLWFTPLRHHRLVRKRLKPPLGEIQNVRFFSWYVERVPEILWAVLIADALCRKRRLSLFSSVCQTAREMTDTNLFITHSDLATADTQKFFNIFRSVLSDTDAQEALRPLLVLDGLPDKEHWRMYISPPDDQAMAWNSLASSLIKVIDRRSEESTDIRWSKIMFLALQGRLRLTPPVQHLARELIEYPENTRDDAAALIGSMEMGIDSLAEESTSSAWSRDFWAECFEVTDCVPSLEQEPRRDSAIDIDKMEFVRVYGACVFHCMETTTTTAVDPVHEGTFGIALFATATFAQMFGYMSRRAAGRNLLRTLAEAHITLSYLQMKGDQNLWLSWRNHGSGQAKLAFLKLMELTEKPTHVYADNLEALANEDMWMEYSEINVGSWSGTDLRQMAEEAGVKDIYDSYFVWPSSFVHAQWGAVRDSVYTTCLNPLHRFHRIPRPPRRDLGDIGLDALRLVNRTLDLVEKAYPGFTERFVPATQEEDVE